MHDRSPELGELWEAVNEKSTDIMNYYVTICAVEALRRSLELPFSAEQIQKSEGVMQGVLVAHYRRVLEGRLTVAQNFLEEIQIWSERTSSDLASALRELKQRVEEAEGQ